MLCSSDKLSKLCELNNKNTDFTYQFIAVEWRSKLYLLVKSVEKHILVFWLSARFLVEWSPMLPSFYQTTWYIIVEVQIFTNFFNTLVMVFTRFW